MGVSISVREARPDEKERWNRFVLAAAVHHHSYLHNWSTVISRAFGQQPRYLLAESAAGEIVGILPLVNFHSCLFGRSLTSIPFLNAGGIITTDPAVESALRDHLLALHAKLNTSYIELRNITPLKSLDEQFNCSPHKVAYELELSPPEELFESFPKKLRAQIKRPQKSGYSVKFYSAGAGAEDGINDFYKVFSRNMRDLGTPVYSKRFISAVITEFGPLATLAIVYGAGRPVACGLLIGCGIRIEMLLASSLRKFNADAPNMLLYWEAMQWAYNHGFRIFDFGRSSPGSGPARFKEQWGAKQKTLHWYYHPRSKVSSSVKGGEEGSFGLAVRIWRSLPLPIANLCGPIISRHIP